MPKRDRWDSSSEDEESKQEKSKTATRKTTKAVTTTLTTTATTNSNQKQPPQEPEKLQLKQQQQLPQFPLHNPLLQGCRSVYDTYERIARVSEGTYGIVWKAKDMATNEIVALKQIKFDDTFTAKVGFPVTALREINVLLSLSQHNNDCIVTVKEMVVGDAIDKVFMVMEYMELDLQQALQVRRKKMNSHNNNNDPILRQSELKSILQQILSGIHHMHGQWFLHRDLKTSNILVHRSGRVALCDLGLARRYQDPLRKLTLLVVTLWYRSPELLFGEDRYGPAVDMWSIGCILGELLAGGEAMLQGQGELDQMDKIFKLVGIPTEDSWPGFTNLPAAKIFRWNKEETKRNAGESLAERFPINTPTHVLRQTFLDGHGFDLLSQLVTLDPQRRITSAAALTHSYFSKGVSPQLPDFFDESAL